MLVSTKLAKKTGVWQRLKTEDKIKDEPLRIKFEEALAYFEETEQQIRSFNKLTKNQDVQVVYYEQIQNNWKSVKRELQSFLGVKIKEKALKKRTSANVRELIVNYPELKRRFKNTKWSKFFGH